MSVQLLQTKLYVSEMFLLGEMLTLLSCDASRTVTILRVGNADSSTSISFSCFSLNLSRKLRLEFYCSS